jgi:Flp pilus assembly pilin Flp
MAHVARLVIALVAREDGQDLIEYALLVGLIVLVAVVAVSSVGSAVNNVLWQTVSSGLNGAV